MKATQIRSQAGPPPVEALLQRLRPEIAEVFSDQAIPSSDAEDLLQETLYALVFKWEGIRNPEAWLLSTLKNRCSIYRRNREENLFEAVDSAILDALAGPQEPTQQQAELRHDLNAALCRLPERHRNVLHLRFGLGCKSAEIAEKLGYESEGMRRLTNESLAFLTRELKNLGLTPENARA
jgi:RNA polymerase sigma factor (sigma-70 family)